MHDLAVEMYRVGHSPVVIVPTFNLPEPWAIETVNGVVILRLRAPKIRDIGYVRRTLNEFLLPLVMLIRLSATPFARTRWDLVAWYSPTIFFGPLIWRLKIISNCPTYLILRDIFPEWAKDLGLIRHGSIFKFFKVVARMQYSVADVIGVQSESNIDYLQEWRSLGKHVEVLYNWQTPRVDIGSGIDLASTPLAGRRIAVYVGNMGPAQGMYALLDLAMLFSTNNQVGFLFVGRGSEFSHMKKAAASKSLINTFFVDEIDPSKIPGLLSQCFVGLIALDPRHKTHNIPGKFLSYMFAGLPVVACINGKSDLMNIINENNVGRAFYSESSGQIKNYINWLLNAPGDYCAMADNARELAERIFSTNRAVTQIIRSTDDLTNNN